MSGDTARIVQQLETSERDRKHYRHDQIENYSVSKAAITKECMALLKEACNMFDETGCVPGIDGEQVPAERIVPDVKAYISETIDDPETMYDQRYGIHPGLRLSFRGWHKNGVESATSSHLAAVRTLSNI